MGSDKSGGSIQKSARVSIHAPTWGATGDNEMDGTLRHVSIHAPTWGATAIIVIANAGCRVSIHAPTWGATFIMKHVVDNLGFNPRSHMGSDIRKHGKGTHKDVSIHAPTWGATTTCGKCKAISGFQSTLPHGERQIIRDLSNN